MIYFLYTYTSTCTYSKLLFRTKNFLSRLLTLLNKQQNFGLDQIETMYIQQKMNVDHFLIFDRVEKLWANDKMLVARVV